MIDALWGALGEALERIEQLEEQPRTDSGNSSKGPSSDSPRSRAHRLDQPTKMFTFDSSWSSLGSSLGFGAQRAISPAPRLELRHDLITN